MSLRVVFCALLFLMLLCCTTLPRVSPTPGPLVPLDLKAAGQNVDLRRIAADYPPYNSSTSAQPLAALIACKLQGWTCVWTQSSFDDEWKVLRQREADEDSGTPEIWMHQPPAGTHGAYVALIETQADIIFVARAPSEDEFALAEQLEVELDFQPLALDAFVFIAHVKNGVESLPLETYRAIYRGEITEWPDTGTSLQPYRRDRNSGSQELMEALVMEGEPMIEAPEAFTTLWAMQGPIHRIAEDASGLAYSVYFYVRYMRPHPKVKLLGVDGVLPTPETIADRSYPLATEVYVVIRAAATADDPARLLRDWLLTEEGQAIVAESGYIPLK